MAKERQRGREQATKAETKMRAAMAAAVEIRGRKANKARARRDWIIIYNNRSGIGRNRINLKFVWAPKARRQRTMQIQGAPQLD